MTVLSSVNLLRISTQNLDIVVFEAKSNVLRQLACVETSEDIPELRYRRKTYLRR